MSGSTPLPATMFTYPQRRDETFSYTYNYKDTVTVSWTNYAANATAITLQLFYWLPNSDGEPWRAADLYTVAANSSMAVRLDAPAAAYRDRGYYLGQWNLNYTRADRTTPTPGLAISQTFHCNFDDSLAPASWGLAEQPTSSSVASSTPSSTSVADGTASSAATTHTEGPVSGAAAERPAAPSSSLSAGAIAAIVIGVLAAISLGAAAMFVFLRRRYRKPTGGVGEPGASAMTGAWTNGQNGRPKLYPEPGNPFNQAEYVMRSSSSAAQSHHEMMVSNGSSGNYALRSELPGSEAPIQELPAAASKGG